MSTKFCMNCGTKIPMEAKYCCSCGMPQPPSPQAETRQAPPQAETRANPKPPPSHATSAPGDDIIYIGDQFPRDDFVPFAPEPSAASQEEQPSAKRAPLFKLIKNIAILALAAVMLVMAFLPVINFNVEELLEATGNDVLEDYVEELGDIELRITPIDAWVLSLDAIRSLDAEELAEGALTERMEDLMLELEDEIDIEEKELTDRGVSLFNRMLWLFLRLSLQSEDVQLSPALAAFWLLSTLYILLTIALFTVALFCLLGCFIQAFDKPTLSKALTTLLTLMPVVTLALLCAALSFTGSNGVDIGAAPIIILIFSAICIGLTIAHSIALEQHRTKLRPVMRIVTCVLAFTVMLLCFAPLATTSVTAEFRGSSGKRTATVHLGNSFFNELTISDSETDFYEDLADSNSTQTKEQLALLFHTFMGYSKKQVSEGSAGMEIMEMNKALMAAEGLQGLLFIFRAIPILNLLVLLFAGVILQQNLYYLTHRNYTQFLVALCRFLVTLLAVLSLALVLTFVLLCNYSVDKYMSDGYKLGIAAGVIVLTVFSIALTCMPSRMRYDTRRNTVKPLQFPNYYYNMRQ